MKKLNFLKFYVPIICWLIICFSISSCSVSYMPLEVLVPAEISVNREIKHIGIVNRSLPAKRKKLINFLEGFISGESILGDHIGSEYCLKGLAEKLNNSPRFTAVIIEGEGLKGTGTRAFPRPLSWKRVHGICQKYRVDALIALETFDSNIDIDISKRMVKRKIKDKKTGKKVKIKVPRYYADLYIDVNSGWKIYDPYRQAIVDADVYRDRKVWEAEADSKREVRAELPDKREAVNMAGYYSGVQYGIRISPTWIDVRRHYYKKGCPEFKDARRFIKANDWNKAELIWKEVLGNYDKRISGRAAYNIAVAAEVKGDLEKALHWAKKSYTEYGNKSARQYMRVIRTRIEDRERLEEQLR